MKEATDGRSYIKVLGSEVLDMGDKPHTKKIDSDPSHSDIISSTPTIQ